MNPILRTSNSRLVAARASTMLRSARSSLRAQEVSRFQSAVRPSTQAGVYLRSLSQRTYTTSRASTNPSRTTGFTLPSQARPSSRTATLLQRLRNLRFFHNSRARRNGKATSPDPTANLGSPGAAAEAEPKTLGERMKKLSREYGWSAVGVYLMLSALDFPFCYLLVRYLGTDRIGEWEHMIVSNVKRFIPESVKQAWHDWRSAAKDKEREVIGSDTISEHVEMAGWGVEEAEARNKSEASLATQLALAYAIHKSFIFIRVPLTAAVTPRVVKILRGWGWDIGKRTTKEARAANRAALPIKKPKAKFGGS